MNVKTNVALSEFSQFKHLRFFVVFAVLACFPLIALGDTSQPIESQDVRQFQFIHLIQLAFTAGVIFWGYSLLMSGRHGFGWKVFVAIGILLTALGRIAASLFNEVTADNEVGDWDDDSEVSV